MPKELDPEALGREIAGKLLDDAYSASTHAGGFAQLTCAHDALMAAAAILAERRALFVRYTVDGCGGNIGQAAKLLGTKPGVVNLILRHGSLVKDDASTPSAAQGG